MRENNEFIWWRKRISCIAGLFITAYILYLSDSVLKEEAGFKSRKQRKAGERYRGRGVGRGGSWEPEVITRRNCTWGPWYDWVQGGGLGLVTGKEWEAIPMKGEREPDSEHRMTGVHGARQQGPVLVDMKTWRFRLLSPSWQAPT